MSHHHSVGAHTSKRSASHSSRCACWVQQSQMTNQHAVQTSDLTLQLEHLQLTYLQTLSYLWFGVEWVSWVEPWTLGRKRFMRLLGCQVQTHKPTCVSVSAKLCLCRRRKRSETDETGQWVYTEDYYQTRQTQLRVYSFIYIYIYTYTALDRSLVLRWHAGKHVKFLVSRFARIDSRFKTWKKGKDPHPQDKIQPLSKKPFCANRPSKKCIAAIGREWREFAWESERRRDSRVSGQELKFF